MLETWITRVTRHALLVLSVLALVTAGAAWYAVDRFSMNSDTGQLIRQNTPWKAIHQDFTSAFPQYDQNTLVVLSGKKPNALINVTASLENALRQRDDVFSLVFAPGASDFTEEHVLRYLDTETLNDTISRLADAQPFLGAIAEHDNLRGIFELLIDAVSVDGTLPTGIEQISDAFELTLAQSVSPDPAAISWRDELFRADTDGLYYQLIFIKGRQEFGHDLPNKLVISELEKVIAGQSHPHRDEVSIRLTGQVTLEHGEIVSAISSAQLAGTIALVLLIVMLVWGVRSMRIIAATYLTMLCGLIWTAAFAMFTVGQYNTISILFLVMFIGLGVDFAIHFCLKYQESLTGHDKSAAIIDAGTKLGPALMLCGLTSALGFLSFLPTEYVGIAEMGIISGSGMIFAVFLSLTLIPAFFAVTAKPQPPVRLPYAAPMSAFVTARPRQTAWMTIALASILAVISTHARFDYSTLSLKDPHSEAMTTLKELHDEDIVTDYALTYVADDLDAAATLKPALAALSAVSEVVTPLDYLPADQDEKTWLLEDAGFLLDSVFSATKDTRPLPDADLISLIVELRDAINHDPEARLTLAKLAETLDVLIDADTGTRDRFTNLMVPPLQKEIDWLQRAIQSEPVSLENLPADLRNRLIAPDGRAIVSITPAQDVVSIEALRAFTEDVLAIAPTATGRAVLDLGIGDIVIEAFLIALTIAVTSIFIILCLTLRSILDAVLVFIPLTMTALVTLSVSVLAGLPLNMANIVVIPLIFGLGVDNGIHIVKRYRQVPNVAELVRSSTPKAVFLSNLTTLGTFSALSFSSHQGIYSIGVLLTVALISLMLLTLISLPALLATFSRPAGYSQ